MFPWLDYGGKLSPLKLTVFVALFLPAAWTFYEFTQDALGSRPLTEAIHQFGLWTIRFIFLSLAITPLRRQWQWPRLLLVRRMVGVAACAYVLVHLSLYAADQAFDLSKVASEIVLRIYLTIGFIALLSLVVLAATSTDGMIKRLGARRWQRLHRIIYGIGVLAVIHFFLQSKLDEWEPTVMAGLFAWLMGWRLLFWMSRSGRGLPVWQMGVLSLAAGVGTALAEAGYFWFSLGVDPLRILGVDVSFVTGVRPAWIVLAVCAGVTLIGALRGIKWRQLRPA